MTMMTFGLICKATLTIGCAGLAAAWMRNSSASRRHLLWMLALGACLAFPFAPALWRAEPGTLAASFVLITSGGADETLPAVDWLRLPWLAGAAVLLTRLAHAHWRMARLVGTGASGVVHAAVPGAVAWGLWNPVVILPDGNADARDLQHELAHVERRDGWWLLLQQVACAVYWFHPLVWLAATRASEERERACDDLVLASGAAPIGYAERLVAAARQNSIAVLGMGARNHLDSRVRAILDGGINRATTTPRFALTTLAAAMLVLFSMSAARAQEKSDKPDMPPSLLKKVEPEYTEAAKNARINGTVKLVVEIGVEGQATKIRVAESLDPGLDANAIAAVKKWRFQPGIKNGKPVACDATIHVVFRLD